ncbi:uncharacterized protein EV420DRAFT_1651819 [Desarmillaria tabescens]|uniref:Uncharacterized protein n=1 Tax=Armillaria tabescens TaxID=1929756 RepID=A0AA39MKJ5_ARMTA|nr:uncharacterized protein EV420DRAFT_1651819 [Desarmillaria tabescens]KAK0437717.1 hypothetical protein EV420DRAFT_1651819 [Desarmillaria tabescens]
MQDSGGWIIPHRSADAARQSPVALDQPLSFASLEKSLVHDGISWSRTSNIRAAMTDIDERDVTMTDATEFKCPNTVSPILPVVDPVYHPGSSPSTGELSAASADGQVPHSWTAPTSSNSQRPSPNIWQIFGSTPPPLWVHLGCPSYHPSPRSWFIVPAMGCIPKQELIANRCTRPRDLPHAPPRPSQYRPPFRIMSISLHSLIHLKLSIRSFELITHMSLARQHCVIHMAGASIAITTFLCWMGLVKPSRRERA